ncbi:unnamed protein product, partial [marine sediment metagenome]
MLWLANAELASTVSNTGALGIVSPLAGMERHEDPAENLKLQIARARQLTEKPFGVNIPLDLHYSGILIDTLLNEKASIVITAAGNPALYTELLRKNGITVLHVVSSVRQAQNA